MVSQNDMTLVGAPLCAAVFAVLIQTGPLLTVFAAIGSLAIAVAAAAVISAVGGFQILGSGVDVKDWSIKMTFVTVFLTAFYASNILMGLNLILSMPMGIGVILFGILTTMYVFGMFGITSTGSGN